MRKTALPLAMLLLIVAMMPSWTIASDEPSKIDPLPLTIENCTCRFDESTGSVKFDTVIIGENGRLEIVGVSFVASRVITREPEYNSSILIDGTMEGWGRLTVTEGLVDVQVENITLGRAELQVMWAGALISTGDAGKSSYLKMETLGGGIEIKGTNIEILGQDGGVGDDHSFGGPGGDSQIIFKDSGKGDIDIRGAWMRSLGGKGGGAPSGNVDPGEGGRSDISIEGQNVNLRYSYLYSNGGKAGPVSQEAEGNTGGSGMMRLHSEFDMTLHDTDLTVLPGNNSGYPKHPSSSNILMMADHGSVRWDHNKTDDYEMSTLSYVKTPSLQIDAGTGARLHQVHLGETYPTSLDDTEIQLYWWIDLYVTDDLGSLVEGALVFYNINEGSETYPYITDPLITDHRGHVSLELSANMGLDWIRYRFFTQFGAAYVRGSTDTVRFDENSNRIDTITLQLAEIKVLTDMEAPQRDLWNITGTAYSLTGNPINSMKIHVDDELVLDVIDHSGYGDEQYSHWSCMLNISRITPGIHIIELMIVIDDFTTKRNWTVEFPISIYNHPPSVENVIFVTDSGIYETRKGVEYPVHVSPSSPEFKVDVRLWELDHFSKLLDVGEGKLLSLLQIQIVMYDHPLEVFYSERSFTEYDAGDTGRYRSVFEIDTTTRQGRFDPWTSGRYLMKINAFDDAGAFSEEYQVFLFLHVDQAPLLNLRLGREDPQDPVPHPIRLEEVFFFEVAKDRKLKEYFDLTGCKDLDDPSYFPHPSMDRSWKNLTATVYIQPVDTKLVMVFGPVKGAEGFEHTFDLKNYSNGDSILFEIVLRITDADGVESELVVLADVAVGPPVDVESEPLPLWVILFLAAIWIMVLMVSFIVVLPIYSRRKVDRVRRLLKDPKLQGAARKALKGEKPSDHFISRKVLEEGLKEKVEKGAFDPTEYRQLIDEMNVHKKK